MNREFKKPKNFESLLYISQILQADGIRTAIEAHRRNKATCMGSLYWQLNDCWPGASWSGIDYYGKWKALHYNVKKAFKPVIISHEFIDSNLQVSVVSDLKKPFIGEVEISLIPFKGDSILQNWKQQVSFKPFEVGAILTIFKSELPKYEKKKSSYLKLVLKEKGKIISSKNVYFLPFKDLKIANPEIEYKAIVNKKEHKIDLIITCKKFAKGINITCNSQENFSENFFDLDAGQQKKVSIYLNEKENSEEILKTIKLKSLVDGF
jgi:beta-mannosidase